MTRPFLRALPNPDEPEPNTYMMSSQEIEIGHTLKSKNAAAFLLFKPSDISASGIFRAHFRHFITLYFQKLISKRARVGGFGLNLNSETNLVEAAQNGHLESFAALYQHYWPAMIALAYAVLADIHLAEDAAQETFAIACHDLPNLRRKEKFGSWLSGICRNVARQMRRRENQANTASVRQPVRNPDGHNSRTDVIRRAVWNLRPAEREPIVLRYYDNLSYEQIAQLLDISIQAVNGRLIRAKREIAKQLKRRGFTRGDYERP